MLASRALVVWVVLAFASPSFAFESSLENTQNTPAIRTNFNLGTREITPPYPQGKNNERTTTETLAQELNKPNDFICFGQACVCESVKHRK